MSNRHITILQAGLGVLPEDGIRGAKTTAAILAAADAGRLSVIKAVALPQAPKIINTPDASALSGAAEAKLVGVKAVLADTIREAARRSAVPFIVTEGLRTAARQAQLVAAGASKTQNSRHLTGHAVDLWPVDPATGKPVPSDAAFKAGSAQAKAASARLWSDLRAIAAVVKAVAKDRGVQIEWGGDWGWDAPHVQLNRVAYPA